MMLRTRLTLVFALSAVVLLLAFGVAMLTWHGAEEARVNRLVLESQQVSWRRFEAEEFERLRLAAVSVAATRSFAAALAKHDSGAVRAASAERLEDTRIDVFDSEGQIVYTSSMALSQELQLDEAGVRGVLDTSKSIVGLIPTSNDEFSFVAAVPVHRGSEVIGGVVLGMGVEERLRELSKAVGSPVAIVNLRGRAVGGDAAALYNLIDPDLVPRRQGMVEASHGGHAYRVVGIPVFGHDARQVGSFVTVLDVSADHAHERVWLFASAGVLLLFVAGILAALFVHLRSSFEPLAQAVEVLTALSRGDTSTRLDAEQMDEAGQIADGVGRLRSEMINLRLLREERQRERWRQERIIREELRELAGTLDESAREEILSDLHAAISEQYDPNGASFNQLAMLSLVLGRLSRLIRDQQQRLHGLIRDLNEALRAKEAFIALQQELEIARRMQLSVLPRFFPVRADVSLASFILPAREVGGDFYDYFLLDGGRLGVVVADVSGKGVPAAFFMAICRTLLKVSARFLDSPAETLARVNNLLAAENEEMMFVTLFYGVLEPSTGRFVYASGGHNPPVLRSGNDIRPLSAPGGMALAITENTPFAEGHLTMLPGDVLFLYTDGITEAQNPENMLFGEAALLTTLASVPPDAPVDAYPTQVVKAVQQFMRGAPQADDITCVTLRYAGVHVDGPDAGVKPESLVRTDTAIRQKEGTRTACPVT